MSGYIPGERYRFADEGDGELVTYLADDPRDTEQCLVAQDDGNVLVLRYDELAPAPHPTPEEHREAALSHIVARCVSEEFGRESIGFPGSIDRIVKTLVKRLVNHSQVDESAEWDGTSAAHPAWWRGQDDGVRGATERVQHALDVDLSLCQSGTIGYGPLQEVVERIIEIRRGLKRAEEMADSSAKAALVMQKQRDVVKKDAQKLQAFKEYVHGRLDAAGVPHDPEPEQNAEHGCRIEGRLNHVLKRLESLRKFKASVDEALNSGDGSYRP